MVDKLNEAVKENNRLKKQAVTQANKQKIEEQKLTDALTKEINSIKDLTEQTNALVKQRDRLNISTAKGRKEFENLSKQIADNTSKLKSYDAQIGRFHRNVGNYRSVLNKLNGSLVNLAGAFGVGFSAIQLLGRGIKDVVNITLPN